MTGRVVSVELEGRLFPDVAVGLDDMPRMAVYTGAVDEVFKGDPSQIIRTTRASFVRYGDELRPVLLNGVPPNQAGDRILWFLTSNSDPAEYFQVSISGLVVILDGVITTELYENVEGVQELKGELADDVFAWLRGLAEDS